jgi:uncharacterized protein
MSSDSIAVDQAFTQVRIRTLRRMFLSARWQLLAMLNWEIDPAILEPLVPPGCELDFHSGKTFVSLVGFLFLDTRVLGVPVPFHRNFEEVNLRFYVRRRGGEQGRGVAFIKEIVPRWTIAQTARLCYNEPYVALPMAHEVTGPAGELCWPGGQEPAVRSRRESCGGKAAYRWRFDDRWNSIELQYMGERAPLVPGSHEEFIAEQYFGYCAQRDGGTIEYQVEHPPWNIWPAVAALLDVNVGAFYGPRFAAVLTQPPMSAFLADGSAVAVMRPRRIG